MSFPVCFVLSAARIRARARAIYRARSLKYRAREKKEREREGRREKDLYLERRFAEQVIGPAVVNETLSRLVERFRLGEIGRHSDWNLLIGCLIEMGNYIYRRCYTWVLFVWEIGKDFSVFLFGKDIDT